MKLIDRHRERAVLDRLLEAVRAGESRALVVCGEAGVGTTASLEYLAGQTSGCRLARIAGAVGDGAAVCPLAPVVRANGRSAPPAPGEVIFFSVYAPGNTDSGQVIPPAADRFRTP